MASENITSATAPNASSSSISPTTFIKYNIDNRILVKNKSELLAQPRSIFVNHFDESSAKKFAEDMHMAEDTGQEIIPIYIDSYGGYCDALTNMFDVINSCSAKIATIAVGKAMSCGALLLSYGTEGYRYMGPNSRIMIHEVASSAFGKVSAIKADAEESMRLNKMLMRIMSNNSGHEDDYFWNIIHEKSHADWYLTAQEAKKHNLINHIKFPRFDVSVDVKVKFG